MQSFTIWRIHPLSLILICGVSSLASFILFSLDIWLVNTWSGTSITSFLLLSAWFICSFYTSFISSSPNISSISSYIHSFPSIVSTPLNLWMSPLFILMMPVWLSIPSRLLLSKRMSLLLLRRILFILFFRLPSFTASLCYSSIIILLPLIKSIESVLWSAHTAFFWVPSWSASYYVYFSLYSHLSRSDHLQLYCCLC